MSTKQNKRRSPAEILAAKQAEMARLAVRAAKDSGNPELSRLQASIADLNGEIIEHQRGFSKGPQSFASRIQGHKLWIKEIEAQQNFANISLQDIQIRKAELQKIIAEMAADLANGIQPNAMLVDKQIEKAFTASVDVEIARHRLNKAKDARKGIATQSEENAAGA
jgi:hypothetical protein